MVDPGKREDAMLDLIGVQGAAIARARRLVGEFTKCDPGLWPILSEIDLVLTLPRR